jgi:hypothetical protein
MLDDEPMGDQALAVARSLPIFPCGPDKRPLVATGFKAATKDLRQVEIWWRQWPDALIGVPTGAASGFFVIDVDAPGAEHGDVDGLLAWDKLTKGRPLPPTRRHETPNGGLHILFKYDPARPVTNSRGALPEGVDVRGDGGYVIWPPSKLPDGRAWRVQETCETDVITDAPELHEILAKKPATLKGNRSAYGRAALDGEIARAASARKGQRNETLNIAALKLGRVVGTGALPRVDAEAGLYGVAEDNGLVGEDGPRAVLATIKSGLDAGVEQPRKIKQRHQEDSGPRDDGAPPPGGDIALPPPPELEGLTADAWAAKQLPPRDHLMGTLLSTTSRWMVQGDTGVGKTLFVMAIAMGAAANRQILNWAPCGRKRRVMYVDGDMPAETFQERVKLMLALYGAASVEFFAYNLDELEREGRAFEPFNTIAGRAWLEREIERIKPDLIVFDSVMCLTIDAMTDDRSWRPVAELMGWLTGRRIAQIWVHHTGHDPNRGFGTKSREWRLDTVVLLTEANKDGLTAEEGAPVEMRFKKARLRRPQDSNEFEELKIACGPEGWRTIERLSDKQEERPLSDRAILTRAFCNAYDELANGVEASGYVGDYKILKVNVDKLRDHLKSTGWLDVDEKGRIIDASRSALRRIKSALLGEGGFQEQDGMIWRARPHPARGAALMNSPV